MKKLSIGDLMSYHRIEGVKKSRGTGVKYEAKRGDVFGLGDTPLQAVHTLVSAIKEAKA